MVILILKILMSIKTKRYSKIINDVYQQLWQDKHKVLI